MTDDRKLITLFRPAGQEELDLVAESGHREWPPRLPSQPIFYPVLNRAYATKITRDWNAPSGVGYVTAFDVDAAFLGAYEVRCVGAKEHLEYWIPSGDLPLLNANIVGRIRVISEYRAPVPEAVFAKLEEKLRLRVPPAWRAWQCSGPWFHRGSMADGSFVWLYRAEEIEHEQPVFEQIADLFPGALVLGNDGASERLVVDLREEASGVFLANVVSEGWPEAIVQASSVHELVTRIESGTFRFVFDA